jgi:sugar lactone lactonase YvrE
MSTSKTDIGGKRRPAALGLLLTTSLALLLLLVGGAWSSARATGPALWMAVPQPQPGPPGAVGGLVEIRPVWLTIGGAVKQVKIEEGAEPLANASGLAFQPNGVLWVCTLNNTILKFGVGQLLNLAHVPHPAPKVTITSTAFNFNVGCVLDSHGNLWVVDASGNGVHEISHAQLIAATLAGPAPQNITPAVTITSTALSSPAFATFDAGGNLWVTSEANNNIAEFKAGTLSTGGAKTPDVLISSSSVSGPGQPQFDAAGDLWVTNALNNTVVKFTPAHLAASGSPAADAIISDDGHGSLVTPWGCAFDSLGRLWVFNYGTATSTTTTISMYGRFKLAVAGPSSPTPTRTLDGLQPFAAQLTFGPRY